MILLLLSKTHDGAILNQYYSNVWTALNVFTDCEILDNLILLMEQINRFIVVRSVCLENKCYVLTLDKMSP